MNYRAERSHRQSWTLKKIICYLLYLAIAKHLPGGLRQIGSVAFRIRRAVSRSLLRECEGTFGIARGVDFGNGACLVLRDHANIGAYSYIAPGGGLVTIGRHVMMGRECMILAQNHRYLEDTYDGEDKLDVLIDDYAWLGNRVIVLPGVRVGKYAIVGAGAVVSRDVPDYGIAVGNPARVVKYRKKLGD